MVSLRRGALHLLALRRLIALDGTPLKEVRLAVGQVIDLADGVALVVEHVEVPPMVLALRAPGLGLRPLGSVASIVLGPPLSVVGRFVPGAAACLWSVGAAYRLRIADGSAGGGDHPATAGGAFTIAATRFDLVLAPLAAASPATTELLGGVGEPLRLVAHYDTVEVHRSGHPPVIVGGQGARLLSELVTYAGPISWDECARQIWPDDAEPLSLRHRWDVALGRLRRKLREAGLRADLLLADGAGQIQLRLYAADVVEDRT